MGNGAFDSQGSKSDTIEKWNTIAEETGISPKLMLEWLNWADLAHIKGIA